MEDVIYHEEAPGGHLSILPPAGEVDTMELSNLALRKKHLP
jgi:hypothetical protein